MRSPAILSTVLALAIGTTLFPTRTHAQECGPLAPGDQVFVVTGGPMDLRGRVITATDTELEIEDSISGEPATVSLVDAPRVVKGCPYDDPVADGILIGAAVGGGTFLMGYSLYKMTTDFWNEGDAPPSEMVVATLVGGVIGGLLGLASDSSRGTTRWVEVVPRASVKPRSDGSMGLDLSIPLG